MHLSVRHSLLLLNMYPVIRMPHIYLFIRCIFGLFPPILWIMMLWVLVSKFLCGCVFFFSLGVEVLGRMVTDHLSDCQPFPKLLPHLTFSFPSLLLSVPLLLATLEGMKWDLIVAVICSFLTTDGIGHLFMGLLGTCISSLEKGLFISFAHLKLGLSAFLLLSCESSIYIYSLGADFYQRDDLHHLECFQRQMPEHFLPISFLWLDTLPQTDKNKTGRILCWVSCVFAPFSHFVQSTIKIYHWAIVICSHHFRIVEHWSPFQFPVA